MIKNLIGVKLCGLLLVFFTIFGLSFVVSSDVSAKKYNVTSFNIGDDELIFRQLYDHSIDGPSYVSFTRSNTFNIDFLSADDIPSGFKFPRTWRFWGDYNGVDNICSIPIANDHYYNEGFTYTPTAFSSHSPYFPDYTFNAFNINSSDSPVHFPLSWSDPSWRNRNSWLISHGSSFCNMRGMAYSSSSSSDPFNMPRWNFGSLVNINLASHRVQYEKSTPFTYQYDAINLRSSSKVDGTVYVSNGLKSGSLFGTPVHKFRSMVIPFGLFNDVTTDISDSNWSEYDSVTSFKFGGRLSFDSSYTIDGHIGFNFNNYYDPYFESSETLDREDINDHRVFSLLSNPHSSSVSDKLCSVTEYHTENGMDSNYLTFECTYDPVSDGAISPYVNFMFSSFELQFRSRTDSVNFLDTSGDFKLSDFYIITNNDPTPAGWSATLEGTGGDVTSMPANNVFDESPSVDFVASLNGLFNFIFINPFAPLFSMFTDNASCASIPTIASMIHSDSTTVCPWFDSTTRAIVTPVLSIASMMLVFGFAVRWLGSSSGNLFEDTGGVDSGNLHFGSKYRRDK